MDKKKFCIIGAVAAVVIIGVVIAIAVATSNKGDEDGDNKDKNGSSQQENKDKKDDKKTTISEDDLKKVDETIDFGDYDAQQTLSKAIQNGEKTGKVVKIEGTVSHFGKGMSFNIGQKKTEGNQFIGTTFVIEDVEGEDDYPKDGDHVVITGIVKAEGYAFQIKTLKKFVEKK